MALWHVDELHKALISRAWRVQAVQPDEHSDSICETWRITRGEKEHAIRFYDFGHWGERLPLDQCYACRTEDNNSHLYFSRRGNRDRWHKELKAFLDSLETCSE